MTLPLLQRFNRLAALRTQAALGLRPALTPVMLFVPLGMLLGPIGLGLLTPRVLAHLDVVLSVTLATLGVFVGIAAGSQRGTLRPLVAASVVEGIVTVCVVSFASLVLILFWRMPLAMDPLACAAVLGIAAAASAAPGAEQDSASTHRIAARVADLDDVLPIVLGGVVLSLMTAGVGRAIADLSLTLAVGAGAGIAGWLLFDASEGAERGVFVIGTLALAGGAAAFLGTSPLVAGIATGFVWARTPGHTDRIAAADLRKVEHPFVVLLLIIAGASLQLTLEGLWLIAPYVLFRTTGKLAGGWLASHLAPGIAPSALGAYLVPPGVLGIGFILTVQQVVPAAAAPVVCAVTLGAVICEFVAVIVTPVPERS